MKLTRRQLFARTAVTAAAAVVAPCVIEETSVKPLGFFETPVLSPSEAGAFANRPAASDLSETAIQIAHANIKSGMYWSMTVDRNFHT